MQVELPPFLKRNAVQVSVQDKIVTRSIWIEYFGICGRLNEAWFKAWAFWLNSRLRICGSEGAINMMYSSRMCFDRSMSTEKSMANKEPCLSVFSQHSKSGIKAVGQLFFLCYHSLAFVSPLDLQPQISWARLAQNRRAKAHSFVFLPAIKYQKMTNCKVSRYLESPRHPQMRSL